MKKYTLYRRQEQHLAVPADVIPPQAEICEKVKTFSVEAPYMLNAAAYAQIYNGLLQLGYKNPSFTMQRLSPQRYRVDIDGTDISGVWDTHRKTFVD